MNESAIADLVDRHYAELFDYLYRLLYDRERAAALAQETFLRAYGARDRLAPSGGQRLWLFQTASQLAGAARVSRFVRHVGANLFTPSGGRTPGSPLPVLAWGVPGPLERALAGLPVSDRALVLLAGRYGFTAGQAARAVGLAEGSARQRLAEAYDAFYLAYKPRAEHGPVHAAIVPLLPGAIAAGPAGSEQAGEHLASCPECRARLAAYRAAGADLARLPRPWPDRHQPVVLAAAMRRADVSGFSRMGDPRPKPVSPRLTRAATAILVIAVAAGLWAAGRGGLRRPGASPVATPTVVAASTPEPPPAPPTPTPPPPPRAGEPGPQANAWLGSHAMPLTSVEPGSKSTDLEPFAAMVGDVRVVALDDDTDFGSHEVQAFRQRVLEMLVQEKSFNTLVLQVDWAAGQLLDQYVQGAGSDPVQVLDQVRQSRGLAGGIWQSQEMLYTLRWLRAHNERVQEDQRVSLRGFLPIERPSNVPRAIVVDYLQRVDPTSVERAYGDYQGLLAFLRGRRDQYVTRSRYADYRRALTAAQVLVQYDRLANTTDTGERSNLYDSAALDNLVGIAELAAPGSRAMLWTQSLASSGLPGVENLLQSVRRQPGGAVAVNFAFGQGSLYLVGKSEPEPPGLSRSIQNQYGRPASARLAEYTLPTAAPDTYEDYFARAGQPRFYLDLRHAFGDDTATGWLRGPHYARSVASNYWDCFPEDYYREMRLSMSYDMVVYFDRVTPATLLARPPALPDANCPHHPIGIDLRQGIHGWTTEGNPGEFSFGTGYAPGSPDKLAAFIRTTSSEQPQSRGALTQSFRADAYQGRQVQLRVRTLMQGTDARADLWLAMTGLGGETLTSVTKPVLRGSGWHSLGILVDVPPGASRITFGVRLRAPGGVWFTDQQFEIVGPQPAK